MKICLKNYAKKSSFEQSNFSLKDRLPEHIHAPCEVACSFLVEDCRNYYKLNLKILALLNITCQRCMADFKYAYQNDSNIAVCRNDDVADELMSSMECIISTQGEVELEDIITDDLYLYAPDRHENPCDCDDAVNKWLKETSEMV